MKDTPVARGFLMQELKTEHTKNPSKKKGIGLNLAVLLVVLVSFTVLHCSWKKTSSIPRVVVGGCLQ